MSSETMDRHAAAAEITLEMATDLVLRLESGHVPERVRRDAKLAASVLRILVERARESPMPGE